MSLDKPDLDDSASNPDRVQLQRWRLSDSMATQLYQRSFPIEIPLRASALLWRPGDSFPGLGEILFALETLYGPSSKRYDDYKQSFSFPFLMAVEAGNATTHFTLNISDYKGAIDFRLRQMVELGTDLSKKLDVVVKSSTISDKQFEYIVAFLIGWIEGYVSTLCTHTLPSESFYRAVRASLTLYGYDENGFFCKHFEDHNDFDAKVAELRTKMPPKSVQPLDQDQRITETKKWIEIAKQG